MSDVRQRNRKVVDLIVSGLGELGAGGGTATQLQGLVAARHGVALDRRTLAIVLHRAARHGHLVETSRGRFALAEASRCGCRPKPKRAKKPCRKAAKKGKKKCACRKKQGLVKKLMKMIFKRDRRTCSKKRKSAPKKGRPVCRRKPRC